jgi:hypothetical protein
VGISVAREGEEMGADEAKEEEEVGPARKKRWGPARPGRKMRPGRKKRKTCLQARRPAWWQSGSGRRLRVCSGRWWKMSTVFGREENETDIWITEEVI